MNDQKSVSTQNFMFSLMLLSMYFSSGCQPPEESTVLPGMVIARGQVNLDQQRLDKGQITFISEGSADSENQDQWMLANISDGKFEVQIPPGRYAVRIQKYEFNKSGREGKPVLPKKYDQKTTLSAEISEHGPNQLSFQLESKTP